MAAGKEIEDNKVNFIDELPLEMALEIAKKLDLSDIPNFAQVSKQYNELVSTNAFWQDKIEQYFPYLLETNREDCSENAKEFFKKEYYKFLAIVQIYSDITPREWRDALSGKLDDILKMDYAILASEHHREKQRMDPSSFVISKKEILLFYAACNGHEEAISELKKRYALTKHETIGGGEYNAKEGIVTLLNTVIATGAPELLKKVVKIGAYSPETIKAALKHLAMLEALTKIYADIPFDPIAHRNAVNVYLETFNSYLTSNDFKDADHDKQKVLSEYEEIYNKQNERPSSFLKK